MGFELISLISSFRDLVTVSKKSVELSDSTNYRLKSFLPLFSNVLKAIINAVVAKHLSSHGLHSDTQYTSCFAMSTAGVLTAMTEFLYKSLDKNCENTAVAQDISKAFDKVCHAVLYTSSRTTVSQEEYLV